MNIRTECWNCKNKRLLPGNAHIKCVKPEFKMTGDSQGVRNGYFFYPFNFDPIWKTKKCDNFENVNQVIIPAIIPEN